MPSRFGRTSPYTRSLLDAWALVSKEPMYGLVRPKLPSRWWRGCNVMLDKLYCIWHLGPLHSRDWEPATIITLQTLSLVEKAEAGPSLLHTTYAWGTNGVCECKMVDIKSTWFPTWHRMDHVSWSLFWTVFKTHLLEVGLTQFRETMAFWMLATVDFILFYHCVRIHVNRNSLK